MLKWFDKLAESQTRNLAQKISRRNALNRLSRVLVGAAFTLPVLPFDRSTANAAGTPKGKNKAGDDPLACEYWRYCAIDGFLCSCCGGSLTQCPPGTDASKVSWIGTCHNPNDRKDYLVSYNDCCGKTSCGKCMCNTNMRERPGYSLGLHNDVNWCMSNDNSMFHCTTASVVGLAE
jgi:amicyanin-dependent methylamine dehydrogenase small subunit